MDIDNKIEQAESNLQRKLDWHGRYDTRIAFTAGLLLAMLGVLATASSNVVSWNWCVYAVFGTSAFFLFLGIIFIYFSQYPKTKSLNSSLIFFDTISDLECDEFKKKFKRMSKEDYLDDLLSQVHINAEILAKKFTYLKYSLRFLALAIIPWLIAIYFSGIYYK